MIVVVNLIKSVFLSFFISMLIIEIIFLIGAIFGYHAALDENMTKIKNDTKIYVEKISENFISQIDTHYSNVESDLLLVAKHSYPMYLTQQNITNKPYFHYEINSAMYETLGNLNPYDPKDFNNTLKNFDEVDLIHDLTLKEEINFVLKNSEEKIEENNITINHMNKYFDEGVYMENMLKKPELNKVFFNNENTKEEELEKNIKIYLNYMIPIMKSILIRNSVYERHNTTYSRFQLFIGDYQFEYPNNKKTKNSYEKPKDIFKEKNLENPDFIYFDDILLEGKKVKKFDNDTKKDFVTEEDFLISRGCVKIDSILDGKNCFICLEFTFEPFLENLRNPLYKKQKNNLEYIGMFLFGKKPKNDKDLSLYFSTLQDTKLTQEQNNKNLLDELLKEVSREMNEKEEGELNKKIIKYTEQTEEDILAYNKDNSKSFNFNSNNIMKKTKEFVVKMEKSKLEFIDSSASEFTIYVIPIVSEKKFINKDNYIFKNSDASSKKEYRNPVAYFMISSLFGVFKFFIKNFI